MLMSRPKKTLTAKGVKGIRAPKTGREEHFDAALPGFALRITATGHRSWILLYRFNWRPRRLTLASYPAVGLAQARDLARQALQQVANGVDPGHEKAKARTEPEPERGTFASVAHDYIARHISKKRPRTQYEMTRPIERLLLPAWGKRPITDIRRHDVEQILDAIMAEDKPIAANRTHGLIRGLFNWAVDQEYLVESPAAKIKAPAEERERDHVLSDADLRALWPAWETMGSP